MKDDLKNKWILVACIWLGVLALTYWNGHAVDQIILDREKAETFKHDQIFWRQNSKNIQDILHRDKLAFQHVASVRLGLLSVENQLVSLAEENGLSNVKMDSNMNQDSGFGIPSELSFKGPLDGAMMCVNAFEQKYPFLSIVKLKLVMNDEKMETQAKISFYYRYRITGPDEEILL